MKKIQILIFLFVFSSAFSQSDFKLKVSGDVLHPLEFTLSDLSKLKHKNASLKDKDGNTHIYSGIALQDILLKAGVPSGKELHGENLSKYLLVKCTDGYQVLFSLAELDSSIADKNIIIADSVDGKPLPDAKGPLRIVAEGEKKPARSSYQVAALVIGKINK
ncbi:molybdopterin-dependent oxidoreductase [Elizabethkingia anophelis]|uniref:molybdopterin-dependent oxidoreductase n=1 Tax=Elizabethkingia anophelis TaxID=1117645 RepID=UPI00038A4AEC|nr:molybdopterin-dependent oxidoreductase [Elizabethkingia anophelis]EQB90960.1 molybdopterin binding oxidoreductase [Elizabethkingia anophelis 502]MCT3923228.1 molybdopterin-dependent oxidoreductase [Elizabethkingia anophelis]MCT4061961.1 molybdopterin-dependent oxidoreductase [Elizabethkingia anophelis]MCT4108252.1 molybdopterin-dependent oxidoreductase [Elizabethkingia anophelis]MCT4137282.1 molybdopterin-dependent oxidoreductase [Elizabethkingia anophelis]